MHMQFQNICVSLDLENKGPNLLKTEDNEGAIMTL